MSQRIRINAVELSSEHVTAMVIMISQQLGSPELGHTRLGPCQL